MYVYIYVYIYTYIYICVATIYRSEGWWDIGGFELYTDTLMDTYIDGENFAPTCIYIYMYMYIFTYIYICMLFVAAISIPICLFRLIVVLLFKKL